MPWPDPRPISDDPLTAARQRILYALADIDDEATMWAVLEGVIGDLLEASKSCPAKARDMLEILTQRVIEKMPEGGYRAGATP